MDDVLSRIKAEIPDYDETIIDSFICNGIEYSFKLSERVQSDLANKLISLNEIECSFLNTPRDVFSKLDNEDVLFDCKETGIRLIITKSGRKIEVVLACRAERLKIY